MNLTDDTARLSEFVLTKDLLVEGVHYLSDDPPEDVAWKLMAVNLSDLAAKGAEPVGVLLGYPLGDDAWDRAFLKGLGAACAEFACPLLGGDTVRGQGARTLSLTAIGRAGGKVPLRSGALPGQALWVAGTIGDARLGLEVARSGEGPEALLRAYRRPVPLIEAGMALGQIVSAMTDVSDGLLIDAARMAAASELGAVIDLSCIPRSDAARERTGSSRAARLEAATAGDDYALLFSLPRSVTPPVEAKRVGWTETGFGLRLIDAGESVPLPASLGWEHGRD
ncbi:thiamine-phosphate kinase [Sphingomonas spermidinifaciens]|uniref:Thiamine-monophosphate kinase n=2 Tax=Sphingomonas spermidinifaciens TaxID=1141889 RepID=A0A2A4B948_9SPHN|nr:thiamine-phosphate kinase [Sphingomonas spermidinifaciens]